MPQFDFTEEQAWEGGGSVLSPGVYEVEVDDVEEGTSSGNYPQVTFRLRALNGLGQIMHWQTITQNGLGRWVQIVEALGVPKPGAIEIPSPQWSQHVLSLGGKRCWIQVVQGYKPDGTPRAEVADWSAKPLVSSGVSADTEGLPPAQAAQASPGQDKVPF